MLLEVNNIEVIYNEVILVLKGLSLKVPESQIIALLGSNGAGKTTTLKAISGLLKPENGEVADGDIYFEGKRIDKIEPERIVKLGITQVMEGRKLFDELTVEENLRAGSYIRRNAQEISLDYDKVYNYFYVLNRLKKQRAGYLSGGEQQMLVIAMAMMTRPKLLLLDEPSLGLAPLITQELFRIIRRINKEEGTSILLVEQNAHLALAIAQYGYIMESGRIVLDGSVEALKSNRNVKEFYLGLTEMGELKNFREVKHYTRRKRWFSS